MDDGLPLDTQGMASGDPGAALALEQGGETTKSKDLRKVASAQDYEALPHGSRYLDPEGKQRFGELLRVEPGEKVDLAGSESPAGGKCRRIVAHRCLPFLELIDNGNSGSRAVSQKGGIYPDQVGIDDFE